MNRLDWYQKESDRLVKSDLDLNAKDYMAGLIARAVNNCGTA